MPQLRLDGSSYDDLEFDLIRYLRLVEWAPVKQLARRLGTDRHGIWMIYHKLVEMDVPIQHGSERLSLKK